MTQCDGTSQAAEPDQGSAAFLFLQEQSVCRDRHIPEPMRTTQRSGQTKEVTHMTIDGTTPGSAQAVEVLPCRADPELYFAESPADLELAKYLCTSYPVRAECIAGALARREPWGAWGAWPPSRPWLRRRRPGRRTAGTAGGISSVWNSLAVGGPGRTGSESAPNGFPIPSYIAALRALTQAPSDR